MREVFYGYFPTWVGPLPEEPKPDPALMAAIVRGLRQLISECEKDIQ